MSVSSNILRPVSITTVSLVALATLVMLALVFMAFADDDSELAPSAIIATSFERPFSGLPHSMADYVSFAADAGFHLDVIMLMSDVPASSMDGVTVVTSTEEVPSLPGYIQSLILSRDAVSQFGDEWVREHYRSGVGITVVGMGIHELAPIIHDSPIPVELAERHGIDTSDASWWLYGYEDLMEHQDRVPVASVVTGATCGGAVQTTFYDPERDALRFHVGTLFIRAKTACE